MLRPALVLMRKDLRLRVRDRSVLLFAVVVPLGLTLLFSVILPETEELHLTAAVVDLDEGAVAAAFSTELVPRLVEDGVLTLAQAADEDEARRLVTDGAIDAAWLLPAGMTEAVDAGEDVRIEVLVADGRPLRAELARAIATRYAAGIEQVTLAVATALVDSPELAGTADLDAVIADASGRPSVFAVDASTVGSGAGLDFTSYLAAGMAAFFVFFTVQFGVIGLLEERQQGTISRLLAAPIRPAAIQLGKTLGAFLLGLASMIVLAVASTLLLGASWGHPFGVGILLVSLVAAAIGLMALVGSFAKTAEQAGNLQSIVAVVLGMLGGVFFPLPGDALLLRLVTSVSPHGWFLRGLGELVSTGRWTAVLPAAGAILAFGVVAAIPAAILQRRAQTW